MMFWISSTNPEVIRSILSKETEGKLIEKKQKQNKKIIDSL